MGIHCDSTKHCERQQFLRNLQFSNGKISRQENNREEEVGGGIGEFTMTPIIENGDTMRRRVAVEEASGNNGKESDGGRDRVRKQSNQAKY